MASVNLALPPDYWKNLSLSKIDLEFVSNYLFEKETPLTENELVPVLIEERVRSEREILVKQKQSIGRAYLPKEHYQSGDSLVFPALDWAKGKVISQRPGVNPSAGEFEVIEVEFDDGLRRQFAAGLSDHKLNQSTDADDDDQMLNVVLEEADDKPLPTSSLVEQIELPRNVNPKLIEFSMNYALQEDGRFDEVGPAGEVLWCLKRLEPADVQQIPAPLHYISIEYDRSKLSHDMLMLEAEIDDELGESEPPAEEPDEVTVSLTYPHWRAGTLPVSVRARGLFPTAYESPRIRFDLVDAHTKNVIPAWAVRQHRYVYGLKDYYQKYGLNPGSLIVVRKGAQPGQTIIEAKVHRPTRDWVRTVLVGSDGGIVFAMLKQNITGDFNERMVIAVPDVQGVDEACTQIGKQHSSFDVLVRDMMKELVKLNVQGHVHAQELYSALNVVRRCPPAPLMVFLAGQSGYKHVGDLHFRMAETEAGDE